MLAKVCRGRLVGRDSYKAAIEYIDRDDREDDGGRFGDATDYLDRETPREGKKPPFWTSEHGVSSRDAAAREMEAVASRAPRCKRPLEHFMLSWEDGEQPSPAQMRQAVEIILRNLGREDHQWVAAAHDDTRHIYIHLVVNRINPITLKAGNTQWQLQRAQEGAREIERLQGWRVTEGWGERELRISQRARDFERQTGVASLERKLRTTLGESFRSVAGSSEFSWEALHEWCAANGLSYHVERAKQGAYCFEPASGARGKVSLIRGMSHGRLVDRLGPYRAPLDRDGSGRSADDRTFAQRLREIGPELRRALHERDAGAWSATLDAHRISYEKHADGARFSDVETGETVRASRVGAWASADRVERALGNAAFTAERRGEREDEEEIERRRAECERLIERPREALATLTQYESTFTVRDVERFALERSVDGEQRERLIEAITDAALVVETPAGSRRFTDPLLYEVERRNAERIKTLATATMPRAIDGAPMAHQDAPESQEDIAIHRQIDEALANLASPERLRIESGCAGAGKSTLAREFARRAEDAGYRIVGLAVAGSAAAALRGASGVEAKTLAGWTLTVQGGWETIDDRTMLLIDEGLMLDSRSASAVLGETVRRGACVRVLFDAEQLESVGAGPVYRQMMDASEAHDMAVGRRQDIAWQRRATRLLREGRTAEALSLYREHGLLDQHVDTQEAVRGAVRGWEGRLVRGRRAEDLGIVCYRRVDIVMANELAHEVMRARGLLRGPDREVETEYGRRRIAVGDRLVVREPIRIEAGGRVEKVAENGDLGTVSRIETREGKAVVWMISDRTGQEVELDTRVVKRIDLGYAATSFRAQGATRLEVEVVLSRADHRRSTYVSLSRHTADVRIHYGADHFRSFDELCERMARRRDKTLTTDFRVVGRGRDVRWNDPERRPNMPLWTSSERPSREAVRATANGSREAAMARGRSSWRALTTAARRIFRSMIGWPKTSTTGRNSGSLRAPTVVGISPSPSAICAARSGTSARRKERAHPRSVARRNRVVMDRNGGSARSLTS